MSFFANADYEALSNSFAAACQEADRACEFERDSPQTEHDQQCKAGGGSEQRPPNWPEPKPIPTALLPVKALKPEFLPPALAPWIEDIADRLQAPPDYVAVSALTAFGSVIGRRIAVKPQRRTDWKETANIWGAYIGRPGMLKSPAMQEALKPIHRLEADAAKDNEIARQAYEAGLNEFTLRKSVKASLTKERLKKGGSLDIGFDLGDEPREPLPVRYRTNDTSYEALGELLFANPAGILVERDEVVSLLTHLDREDQAVARGFYMSGWSGSQPYTFDRIGRGQRHIPAVCISVLGTTQPARIGEYVRRANAGGTGGDGLIQRFGLLVWPDVTPEWENVDEYPNSKAREGAWGTFDRVSKLDTNAALALGATLGSFEPVPCLRFDDVALDDFLGWRGDLERRLRSGEISAALEGHLAKYRKLVPTLALMNFLAGNGDGAITREHLQPALAMADYLESHARRTYSAGSEVERTAARSILKNIRDRALKDGFTARDIHQRDWSGLTDRGHVQAGLDLLADLAHIAGVSTSAAATGGRPTVAYRINPRTLG